MNDTLAGSKMSFRPATIKDLALLEHWLKQPHVNKAGIHDWPWERELRESPPWRSELIAEYKGRPIGYVQIIDPALEVSQYWGDIGPDYSALDIFIGKESDLGKGYGTMMMRLAIERCFSDSRVKTILVDPIVSNKRAHRFYKGLGFAYVEDRTLDGDDCSVFKLTRAKWLSRLQ